MFLSVMCSILATTVLQNGFLMW